MSSTRISQTDATRRMTSVIAVGVVEIVEGAFAKVRLEDETLTALIPWLAFRAGDDRTWWSPDVGEQVAIAATAGDWSQAFILGAFYSSERPAPTENPDQRMITWSDGTRLVYDRAEHALALALTDKATAKINEDHAKITVGDKVVIDATHEQITAQVDQASAVIKADQIEAKVGEASIKITGDEITITAGGSSIVLNAEGIKSNAKRVDWN